MPILSYFLVAGIVLFGGLVLVSSELESKPLPVSQRIGLPAPFKAPPEENTQSPTNDGDSFISAAKAMLIVGGELVVVALRPADII